MFDIGFWELIIIAIIALLVIGPEQLPVFARELGRWANRLRRLIHETRDELVRGLKLDEHEELERKISGLDELMKIAPDRKPGFEPVAKREPEVPTETPVSPGVRQDAD